MLERRAFQDEVVVQKSEGAALREYSRVLVDRTIFEAKQQMIRDAIALCDLCHFTVRENLAFKGA